MGQVRYGNGEGGSREVDIDRKAVSKFDPICSVVILNLQPIYKLFVPCCWDHKCLSLNFVIVIQYLSIVAWIPFIWGDNVFGVDVEDTIFHYF